jgi:hypothetical protein
MLMVGHDGWHTQCCWSKIRSSWTQNRLFSIATSHEVCDISGLRLFLYQRGNRLKRWLQTTTNSYFLEHDILDSTLGALGAARVQTIPSLMKLAKRLERASANVVSPVMPSGGFTSIRDHPKKGGRDPVKWKVWSPFMRSVAGTWCILLLGCASQFKTSP